MSINPINPIRNGYSPQPEQHSPAKDNPIPDHQQQTGRIQVAGISLSRTEYTQLQELKVSLQDNLSSIEEKKKSTISAFLKGLDQPDAGWRAQVVFRVTNPFELPSPCNYRQFDEWFNRYSEDNERKEWGAKMETLALGDCFINYPVSTNVSEDDDIGQFLQDDFLPKLKKIHQDFEAWKADVEGMNDIAVSHVVDLTPEQRKAVMAGIILEEKQPDTFVNRTLETAQNVTLDVFQGIGSLGRGVNVAIVTTFFPPSPPQFPSSTSLPEEFFSDEPLDEEKIDSLPVQDMVPPSQDQDDKSSLALSLVTSVTRETRETPQSNSKRLIYRIRDLVEILYQLTYSRLFSWFS
jgi:hypothetical protein